MSVNKLNICISKTSMTLSVGGVDVGYTKGGVDQEVASEYYRVIADQSLTPVKTSMTGRTCHIRTTLLEGTLNMLRIACNLNATALVSSSLSFDNSENGEVELIFTGKGPNDTTRTATFFSCVAMGAVVAPYRKDAETSYAVDFEVMWNDTYSKFGTCVDAA
jgi:hypothetical protein